MADSPDRWELVRPNRTATLDNVGRRWELRKEGEYDEHTNEDRKKREGEGGVFQREAKEDGKVAERGRES